MSAAPRGEAAIAVDGRLDEAAWVSAPIGSGFIERTPQPGASPPVETTVRVLYDAAAIYVGVEAFVAPGETPRALELTRDSTEIWNDDAISVKVDPRRDGRTTLGFVVNPAGAHLHYLAVDERARRSPKNRPRLARARSSPRGSPALHFRSLEPDRARGERGRASQSPSGHPGTKDRPRASRNEAPAVRFGENERNKPPAISRSSNEPERIAGERRSSWEARFRRVGPVSLGAARAAGRGEALREARARLRRAPARHRTPRATRALSTMRARIDSTSAGLGAGARPKRRTPRESSP